MLSSVALKYKVLNVLQLLLICDVNSCLFIKRDQEKERERRTKRGKKAIFCNVTILHIEKCVIVRLADAETRFGRDETEKLQSFVSLSQ